MRGSLHILFPLAALLLGACATPTPVPVPATQAEVSPDGVTWEASVEVREADRVVTARTVRLRANEPSLIEVASGGGTDSQRVEVRLDTSDPAVSRLAMRYLTRTGTGWTVRAQTTFGWSNDDDPPASATLTVPPIGPLVEIEVRLSLRSLR